MNTLRIFFVGGGSIHDNRWMALCRDAGALTQVFMLDGHRTMLRGADFDAPRLAELPDEFAAERLQALAGLRAEITAFRPDLVHAFGIDAAGYFTVDALAQSDTPFVLQLRGGPEITLYCKDPAAAARMRSVFGRCDGLIADNTENLAFAANHGLSDEARRRCMGAVPGGGGLSAAEMAEPQDEALRPPLVLWPKAYANPSVDGYAIAEGLRLAFLRAPELQLRLLFAHQPDFLRWLRGHWPAELWARTRVQGLVSHTESLDALRQARVMLAPSPLDGVPNALLEAMACGALPVVSPHATLPAGFMNAPGIAYALNLDPAGIADAILRCLRAPVASQRAWKTGNRALVATYAARASVTARATAFYRGIVAHPRKEAL
ncbi:glycosyltransferase [Aquabacterium sp. UBA2148]|uniref:glycosyltransferase n=1 Tax=Aquabacterium sp. UBA2148 TaxID=1946042 RepID=UPI002580E0DD|nr:glycosyltransferase [Aquabacterium sp. UBA2148]